MYRSSKRLLAVVLVAQSFACAGTKIVKLDDDMNPDAEDVGLPIFVPQKWRQLLVITQADNKTSATWMKVPVYPKRPNYAVKELRGWGSSSFAATLSGGVLTSLNAESESKGAETISALGSVVAAAGSVLSGGIALFAGQASIASLTSPAQADARPYREVRGQLDIIQSDLRADIEVATGAERSGLARVGAQVDEAVRLFNQEWPVTLAGLPKIQKSVSAARDVATLLCPSNAGATKVCIYKARLTALVVTLNATTAKTLGLQSEPAIQIFEFVPDQDPPLRRILP